MASTKKKQGYVITRAKALAEYFTASTAYDRPQWVELSEATVYLSVDAAEKAVKKLWMSGNFAAKVQPLNELVDIEMELPPEEKAGLDKSDNTDQEMVASDQSDDLEGELKGTCPECNCEPCECDDAAMADGEPTDELSSDEMSDDGVEGLPPEEELVGDEHEEVSLLGSHLKAAAGMESEETARLHPEELRMLGKKRPDMKETHVEDYSVGSKVVPMIGPHQGVPHKVIHVFDDGSMNIQPILRHGMRNHYKLGAVKAQPDQVEIVSEAEFKMPTRPGNDPVPSENDTTAATMKEPKADMVDFDDPVGEEDKPQTDLTYSGAMEHDEKVKVPAEVMSQLKAVVADFKKAAEDNNKVDDTKGSFAMTAASALEQLVNDLELGTAAGIKQAQIHMTSYMSPIVNHIPADVVNFIGRGGRKSSLKDLFAVKWDKARGVE